MDGLGAAMPRSHLDSPNDLNSPKAMKPFRNLLLVAALAGAVVGCQRTPTDEPGKPIELAFWNGFSGPDGVAMERIVQQFNKEHPNVHVKMQIIPWGTYYDKVTLGLAFGGAPDVFILHANRIPEYGAHGALCEMDDLVAKSGLKQEDFVSRPWEASIYQGKRLGLPLDCHPMGMYYNVDLFRKAGISRPPATREEFLDAARKLTKDTNGDGKPDQWGFAMTDNHLVGSTFLYQFGGGLLSKDGTQTILGDEASIQGLEMLLSLPDKEKVCPPPSGNDGWIGFQTGKVAMAFQGIWMIDSLEKQKQQGFHYAAAPVPFFGPVKTVWAGSHCLAMPKEISGARKEAAWSFIKYLSDHSIKWAQGGQVPVRLSVLKSPEFQALPVQREFAKQLDYVQYEPLVVTVNQIAGFADAAVDTALNHVETPERALKDAARRVDNVLRRQ